MSEPDLFSEHVANLFSEPDQAEPAEASADTLETGPETAAPVQAGDAATPGPPSAQEGEPAVEMDWQKVASARLREINAIRTRHSETRDRMSLLERQVAELRKRLDPNDELPSELLEADPALKYVTGKLKGIEQQLAGNRESQEEQARFQRDTADTVRYAQESRQAFLQHTPDWDAAYKYVRDQFAQQNGKASSPDKDEWLNVQEHIAVGQWRQDGEDPALKIYEMAMASGWRPGTAPTNGTAPVAPQPGSPRIRRVRDAIAAPSPSSIGQHRDMGSDIMSREQFYDQYPQSERIRIFNSDRGEDIFESLMKEGRVPVSMLPRSS